jgi:hypothetical protein
MMSKNFFSESPLLMFPIVALFIFMAVFTVVTIKVLRTDKDSLRVVAGLPLADDLITDDNLPEEAKQ